jgi:hypothetical protein
LIPANENTNGKMFDLQNWKSIFSQLNLELGSQFYFCVSEITTRTGIKINFFFIGEEVFPEKHFYFSHFFFVKGNLNILLLF